MNILKNRIFIGAICLIIAVLIGFVAVPVVNNLTSQTINAVRVKEDVGMGTEITEDMVEIVEIGKINLPSTPATNIKDVVGLYVTVDMKKHDVVYANKVTDKLVLPENKIRKMNVGESSYTIKLGDAYLSKLLPNDIVSFYTFDENGNAVIVPELQYVSVVTTTTAEKIDILTATQVAPDGTPLVPETITFILSNRQTQKLMTLEKSQNFKISLVYRGDYESVIENYLNIQENYLNGSSAAQGDVPENTDE